MKASSMGDSGSFSISWSPPKSDHHLRGHESGDVCELPKPRKKLLGLVSSCSVCGKVYVLRSHRGWEKSWPVWCETQYRLDT
jgi:hypothetical protein